MRIAINNRVLENSGIGVYNKMLIRFVTQMNNKDVEIVPYGQYSIKSNNFFNKYILGLERAITDQLYIPYWSKKNNIDIFHNTRNTGIALINTCKVISTIHDIIPHVYSQVYLKSKVERLYYEIMIKMAIHRSDAIITISEFSKNDLIKYYRVPANKIYIIPQACNKIFKPCNGEFIKKIKLKYDITKKYILTMGGSEYRKNIKTVIEAYNDDFNYDYELVIIGKSWLNIDLSKVYTDKKNIKFLEGVPDKDLCALYNGAETFVYASFYEGFGLPLLEAMNCNTSIIAADASCLPEIAGDAAAYFSPLDVKDLKRVLKKVLENKEYSEKLINNGWIRRQMFGWEKTVAMTYDVYKHVMEMK